MRNIEILKGLLPGSKRKRMAMLMTMDILIACVSGISGTSRQI
jgi:hypothetical protein